MMTSSELLPTHAVCPISMKFPFAGIGLVCIILSTEAVTNDSVGLDDEKQCKQVTLPARASRSSSSLPVSILPNESTYDPLNDLSSLKL